jgi:hypothetical protein
MMAVDATANQATTTWVSDFGRSSVKDPIKAATPNLVEILNPPLDYNTMTELIFQDIGGQEMINISRSDAINGQNIAYSIIKNLKNIMLDYNSNNIIKLQGTSDVYFNNFSIRLEERLPIQASLSETTNVYIDNNSKNLVVELVNLEEDEQVEIEIINQGSYFDDIIKGEE